MPQAEVAKVYLDVALEDYKQDGDLAFFLEALRNVVEARQGITHLASCGDAKLSRFFPGARIENPRLVAALKDEEESFLAVSTFKKII